MQLINAFGREQVFCCSGGRLVGSGACSNQLRFGFWRVRTPSQNGVARRYGGGGLNPGSTQVRTLGLDQRGEGRISTSRTWVQPRFNPDSIQTRDKFNPGSTQLQPRLNPGLTQVLTQVQPRFSDQVQSRFSSPGSTQVQLFEPRFNLRFNPGSNLIAPTTTTTATITTTTAATIMNKLRFLLILLPFANGGAPLPTSRRKELPPPSTLHFFF